MKFILKLLVTFTLLTIPITAQHIEPVNTTNPGNKYYPTMKRITTYDYNSDVITEYINYNPSNLVGVVRTGHSIKDNGNYQYDNYEMGYAEYILPKGLQCTQATLTIKLQNASAATQTCEYAFHLVKLENSILNLNEEDEWNAINSAQSIGTANNCSTLVVNVTNLVNNAASSGKILFGIRSTNPGYPVEGTEFINLHYEGTIEKVDITVKNNMDGYDGGLIKLGLNSPATQQQSPVDNYRYNVNDILNLGAIENQENNSYNYIWNDIEAPNEKSEWRWEKENNSSPISNNQSATYTVQANDDGANLVGYLKKVCNLTFTNNFSAISETGSIKINGSTVSAPTSAYTVIEGNTIQIKAIDHDYYDVRYNFSHWSDGNTQNPRTYTASVNSTITANFIGTPEYPNLHLGFNSYNPRFQEFITLNWTEHPNPGVTKYYIWRKIGSQNPVNIATKYRGTTTYVDGYYYMSNGSNGVLLRYGIQAAFTPDNTVSAYSTQSVHGESSGVSKIAQTDSTSNESPKVEEFALNSNYPNPFNPSTQISYQIPENSFVSLVVYNALGQEVAQLVNQHQSRGQYTVQFDASASSATAANLPSGVYIYKLQANNFSDVKKMLLTK